MPATQLLALFSLAAIWGASFMFMRVAAPEFGIYTLVFIRTVLAALVLLPFVIYAKAVPAMFKHWRSIAVIGLVNTAVPFVLFNYSSLHLQAGGERYSQRNRAYVCSYSRLVMAKGQTHSCGNSRLDSGFYRRSHH